MATGENQDTVDMQRLVGGLDAALDDLMDRHRQRLFHYLIRLLQNESDAEDVAQESFVRVYEHRARFDPRLKFSTWLYTIATNLARDRLRWRVRHPQVSLDAENRESGANLGDALPDLSPIPSETMEANDRSAIIRDAVATLPEELRVPLVLAEYEECSQAEIAAILRCSVKAVEMRIYRARQQLRLRLEKLLPRAAA